MKHSVCLCGILLCVVVVYYCVVLRVVALFCRPQSQTHNQNYCQHVKSTILCMVTTIFSFTLNANTAMAQANLAFLSLFILTGHLRSTS